MRPIQFDTITESTEGGSFKRLPAGNYVCRITDAEDFPEKQYVRLLFDIASGENAGYFSKDDFYVGRPWAHAIYLSYTDRALGMLKGRLHAITDSNPGFDAEAAWNGGRESMFVGKLVGVCFNEEEYENDNGEVRCNAKPGALCRIADVQAGTAPEPRHKTVDGDWISIAEAREREEDKAALERIKANATSGSFGSGQVYADIPFN